MNHITTSNDAYRNKGRFQPRNVKFLLPVRSSGLSRSVLGGSRVIPTNVTDAFVNFIAQLVGPGNEWHNAVNSKVYLTDGSSLSDLESDAQNFLGSLTNPVRGGWMSTVIAEALATQGDNALCTMIDERLYVPKITYNEFAYGISISQDRFAVGTPSETVNNHINTINQVVGGPAITSAGNIAVDKDGNNLKLLMPGSHEEWADAILDEALGNADPNDPVVPHVHVGWDEDGWYLSSAQPYIGSMDTFNIQHCRFDKRGYTALGIEDSESYVLCFTGSWSLNHWGGTGYVRPPDIESVGGPVSRLTPYMRMNRKTSATIQYAMPFYHVTAIDSPSTKNAMSLTYGLRYTDSTNNPTTYLTGCATNHHPDRPTSNVMGSAYDQLVGMIALAPFDDTLFTFYRSGNGHSSDPADNRWHMDGRMITYSRPKNMRYTVPLDVGMSNPENTKIDYTEDGVPRFSVPNALTFNVGAGVGALTVKYGSLRDSNIDGLGPYSFDSIVGFVAHAETVNQIADVAGIIT
jgi:hypothetical protein